MVWRGGLCDPLPRFDSIRLPDVHPAHVAHDAGLHQFDNPSVVIQGMYLGAHLRHGARTLRCLAHRAYFVDRMRQRFLAVDVDSLFEGLDDRQGVRMIGRRYDDAVEISAI